jgi:hypothetical protein
MAVSFVTQLDGADVTVVDVIADADADVAAAVPHGLEKASVDVHLIPLLVNFYTSAWFVAGVTATVVNLTKANAVGSGDGDPQCRVIIRNVPGETR